MKHPVTLALAPDVRSALERLAATEDRSRSWLADHLLREGLAARGALAAPAPQPAAAPAPAVA